MAVERRKIISALVLMAMAVPLVISSRRSGFDRWSSSENFHEEGDRLYVLANSVRTLEASCEQYPYFDFPFCPAGETINYAKKSLKQVLAGDCHAVTKYELKFREDANDKILCDKSLRKDDVEKFKDAIRRNFVYEMAYNNFTLRESVGFIDDDGSSRTQPRYFLVPSIDFHVHYSENQVTEMYISGNPHFNVDITEAADIKVNFSYSVYWYGTEVDGDTSLPLNKTLHEKDHRPKNDDDHKWMSALMIWANVTLLWVGLILIVTLPYLMKYLMRCSNREGGHSKCPQYIRGDTCICPKYTSLLGAILGNGIQLLISICIFFILAYRGFLHPCDLESLCSVILRTYCFTSVVAGYKATSFHGQFTPVGWKECTFQAGTVYFIPALTTAVIANGLVITRSGMSAVPELGIICENLVVWGLVTVVLVSLGGTLAHCFRTESEAPCTTRRLPRDIPLESWYMKTPAQMLFGALLPSIAMFPEMDNIYASLWHFKICGAFHLMLTSFIVVITLTVVVAIVTTSYQFAKHDHQWWWRSVLCGGSPAIFMFVYGIYFFSRVPNVGDATLLRFLGYNACISYAFFLILGTTGFYASYFVFHSTYPQEKHE
ncbi:Putative phagocytic receptor 1b [Morus notabilis]|uniref:Transmembrane 9 superfamily member n=1 Tax=Morus notabilis TaxID=981085 RepID=W9RRE0_9ROSA|nr:Putative phagocytic receptor 1b [Morus notabilis]